MGLLNLVVQVATIFSVLVAAFTIWRSEQMSRRQMNVQTFTVYNDRYEKIMNDFPENAFRARFNMDHQLPPSSEQLTLCILRYLNMSSEEFYLWEKRYIDREVWEIWEDEVKRFLKSPLLQREWAKLEQEFDSYPAFKAFVKEAQVSASSLAKPLNPKTPQQDVSPVADLHTQQAERQKP